jgi:hypothetical protein
METNGAQASAGGQYAPHLDDQLLVVDRLAQDGANRLVRDARDVVGGEIN